MDFFLSSSDGDTLHFPVNPSEVTVTGEKGIETVNIIQLGEVDFPMGNKRTEIQFSSFFCRDYDPSYCQYPNIPNPEEAMEKLVNWRIAGKPIRLLVTDTPINILVLILRTSHRYVGGEPGDIYFEITMRQWQEVRVRMSTEKALAPAIAREEQQRPRSDTKPVPKVYVVKPGDSLWKIAKLQLGDGSKYSAIYDANKAVIGHDLNKIKPGTKLVMPA